MNFFKKKTSLDQENLSPFSFFKACESDPNALCKFTKNLFKLLALVMQLFFNLLFISFPIDFIEQLDLFFDRNRWIFGTKIDMKLNYGKNTLLKSLKLRVKPELSWVSCVTAS